MNKERFKHLIEKQIAMQLTAEEQDELLELLSNPDQAEINEIIAAQFASQFEANETSTGEARMDIFNAVVNIDKIPDSSQKQWEEPEVTRDLPNIHRLPLKRIWWAAAAILLILLAGNFFLNKVSDPEPQPLAVNPYSTIEPGMEGAILTLADGTQVVLDSMGNGLIANQDGVSVALNNGKLIYKAGSSVHGAGLFNTMSTPKGRQFMVVLPDGTKVWLNSLSSLKYPVEFSGHERLVEVSGEAYFEVAKNPAKPFRVNVSGKAQVEVLGTHFNIKAYENEGMIKTTLLEGSVSMQAGGPAVKTRGVMLRPGQQAQMKNAVETSGSANEASQQDIKVINQVDLENVMAWKNRVFNFEGMHLREIMKQFERWYDIEVEFEEGVKDIEFYGELSMDKSLNDVIEAFKDAEVHFKIEGRKLIIAKN